MLRSSAGAVRSVLAWADGRASRESSAAWSPASAAEDMRSVRTRSLLTLQRVPRAAERTGRAARVGEDRLAALTVRRLRRVDDDRPLHGDLVREDPVRTLLAVDD